MQMKSFSWCLWERHQEKNDKPRLWSNIHDYRKAIALRELIWNEDVLTRDQYFNGFYTFVKLF